MPLAPLARNIRVPPNLITVTGLLVTLTAAWVLTENLRYGGILILAGGFLDALDGAVARFHGMESRFGAFLDSVLDRYADGALFIGLGFYMAADGSRVGVILCAVSLLGAFLVSYTRARAEGIGISCTAGLMERPERILLLALGCLTGWILPVLWCLAVLSHITVGQRILRVRRAI